MNYIVDLNKDTRWDISTIGSKAFNLQKLMLLEAKVPPCSVITTNTYRSFRKEGISGKLLEELSTEFNKWDTPLVARSSSVVEDTSSSSKAGVFATVPDVTNPSELKNAIERVWSSSQKEDIAVILQKQLKPDFAGVLFTRNPVTGSNEKVIEYVEGMGGALVSGKKNPERASDKDPRFKGLAEEGDRLESIFGYPLDIEWANMDNEFHILQARPITALPVPSKDKYPTYSMVLAEQFFSGPSSPLFFSLFKFLFENYYAEETAREVGLGVLPKEQLLIKYKDHMYVNTYPTECLLRMAGGLGDFQQQLKVLPEDIRSEFVGLKGKNMFRALGLLSKIVFLLMKRPNLRKSKVDKEFLKKTVPQILIGLQTIEEQPKTKIEMEKQYIMLIELLIRHIRSSKWGLAYCILLSSQMQRFLEKNHIEEPDIKLLALMVGLPNEKTSEGIFELQILAEKYKQNKQVCNSLDSELKSYEEYRKKLETDQHGLQFFEAFESILYRYGHRRLARDLIVPSWRDDPMIPFSMLKNMLLYQNQYEILEARVNSIKKREEIFQEILKQIPIYKRSRFSSNSNYLLRYLSFRELQRFYLDMIISRMRLLFLQIGEMMVKEGFIEEKNDVFFLEIEEIEDYLKGIKKEIKYIAAFRRMSFCESTEKPGLYLRNGIDFNEISTTEADRSGGNVIKGETVSPGNYRGEVKVIENIDSSSSISPGIVLVTKSIDPGQTQAFTSAGGLILEVGGILSHGAILAREFGIPTVAKVNRATKLFKDGQEVVVNGTKGEVIIVK